MSAKKAFFKMNQMDNIPMIYVYKAMRKYIPIKKCTSTNTLKNTILFYITLLNYGRNILYLFQYLRAKYLDYACIVQNSWF